MREAAADLDFEEAARLRDEIKRLRQIELAVVDDPTIKRVMIAQDSKLRRAVSPPSPRARGEGRDEGQGLPAEAQSAKAGPRAKLGRPGMRGGFKKPRGR